MGSFRRAPIAAAFAGFLLTSAFAAPAHPASEREITAPGPNGPLGGTLAQADGENSPIVLIIPGSGPTDRNGNGPSGLNTDTYRMIADGLRSSGVSSLRIDKRGLFGSRSATDNPDMVSLDIYGEDVRSWISVISQTIGAPCVWLLGHSEGGLVALNHAAAFPDGICGLLLAAVPGRPLADVLRDQLAQNPANAPILGQAHRAISALEAGRRLSVADLHPALQALFRPGVQDFWIDLFSFNAPDALRTYGGPVLILQGTNDVQVGLTDSDALLSANGSAERVLLENANHVLKDVRSADYFENLRTYANPEIPLHPAVVKAIVEFIKANRHVR